MAIDIKFDLVGNPEPPTIILKHRNGKTLGQLIVDEKSIGIIDKFNDASEFSFTMNKYINGKVNHLWDKVVDFKLIYCKEWDMHFEITVELDEATETVKTVFCTQLGQAELSQIMLYNIEINTEEDIERDDYKISILYDPDNPDASILHRMLEKAPHYNIAHVDDSLRKIQRSFSFDGTSIFDGFNEVAEEIGCLFVYNSGSDENGKIQRTISVYDLWHSCLDCGFRNESEGYFIDSSHIFLTDELDNMLVDESNNYLLFKRAIECPKCGGKNIKGGYGDDTLIFVTSDELASNGIQLTTDTDAVKNCFKLEAGDDLMTATIRNCNPNGTDYIWYFSDSVKEDMSEELVEKLNSYDALYDEYYKNYKVELNETSLNNYNSLVNKYLTYNEDLQIIYTPIKGYSALMNAYYNTIDLALYLESGLMPNVEMSETDAEEQGLLLEASLPSLIAVTNLKTVSEATANSSILLMAKAIVKSSYKVEIGSSQLIGTNWSGNFIITNYSDEEDAYTTAVISRTLTDWDEEFIKQKMEKMLSKENTDNLSITGLFEKEYDDFCEELKKYALNPLVAFRDACQSCMDILIEQGIGNNSTWSDTEEGSESNLYEKLYVPYFEKLQAIEAEIKVREDEIDIILSEDDGLQADIIKHKNQIQKTLDFENYLGNDLWLEFCIYRREDKYTNDNYISDGLNNAELFKRAADFFEVAENEIFKSSELQHSISTTLNNLLSIPKFKPLVKSFKLGNWIRIRVDDKIYKLRLLEYEIDCGDFDNISVEFSDVTKVKNGITDVGSILSQASSMATSYSSVQRQASQGQKSNNVVSGWVEDGLNVTNTKIIATDNQNQVWDKNGILCREYDPITETYSDEQLKIINSTIAVTDDNWKTTKTAIGKHSYVDPITGELKTAYGINGETLVGKLLIGEDLIVANSDGKLTFNDNGLIVSGNDESAVRIQPNEEESIFSITNNDGEYVLYLNKDTGNLYIKGDIVTTNLEVDTENGTISGFSNVAVSGNYSDLNGVPTKLSQFTNDGVFITKDATDLTNYYKNTETYSKYEINDLLGSKVNSSSLAAVATSGSYNDLVDRPTKLSQFTNDTSYVAEDDLATVATSGSYNDLVDIEELKNWVLEQIQSAMGQ